MRGFMESSCPLWVAFRYGYGWVEHHAFEPADAVSPYLHHSLGTIGICCYGDPSFGGKMQIPELVAGRQRRHEQLFWVPAGAVAPKGRVRRAMNSCLTTRTYLVVAGIVSIARGAAAEITAPGERHSIAMFACVCHDGLRQIALPFDREFRMPPRPTAIALFK